MRFEEHFSENNFNFIIVHCTSILSKSDSGVGLMFLQLPEGNSVKKFSVSDAPLKTITIY